VLGADTTNQETLTSGWTLPHFRVPFPILSHLTP